MTNETASGTSCSSGSCGSSMNKKIQDLMIDNSLSRIRHRLLIMSGKGGVGKSSLSANIAVCLAQKGYQVGLMDIDLHGPSIANMMGVKGLLDMTEQRMAIPKRYKDNLKVVSMQSLMPDGDEAIIWRGPAKTGVIRQFVSEVQWEELDFLVIDAPPGTGDEPLSVAQTIPGAKAVIITTPQDVALSDVRKSIDFCRTVNLEIVGLIENMGPFKCPCCSKTIELFKSGGGERTAEKMGIPFLGTVPFDPNVVKACDNGQPIMSEQTSGDFSKALEKSVSAIIDQLAP